MSDSDYSGFSPPPAPVFHFNFTAPDDDSYVPEDYAPEEVTEDTTKVVNTDPYVFMWTIGINLFSLTFAYFFVLTTRQRRGFFRRVYFPRIMKVRQCRRPASSPTRLTC